MYLISMCIDLPFFQSIIATPVLKVTNQAKNEIQKIEVFSLGHAINKRTNKVHALFNGPNDVCSDLIFCSIVIQQYFPCKLSEFVSDKTQTTRGKYCIRIQLHRSLSTMQSMESGFGSMPFYGFMPCQCYKALKMFEASLSDATGMGPNQTLYLISSIIPNNQKVAFFTLAYSCCRGFTSFLFLGKKRTCKKTREIKTFKYSLGCIIRKCLETRKIRECNALGNRMHRFIMKMDGTVLVRRTRTGIDGMWLA